MEENKNMMNEEIEEKEEIDMTNEIETIDSGKGFKTLAGIGLVAALVGGLAYKFVAKPMIAKKKAEKESVEIDKNVDDSKIKDVDFIEDETTNDDLTKED